MKQIKLHPTDNPNAVIRFNDEHVRSFPTAADFVAHGKKEGHWDGHDEQEHLLTKAFIMATAGRPKFAPDEIPTIVTQEILDLNPDLVAAGLKVGEEVVFSGKVDVGASAPNGTGEQGETVTGRLEETDGAPGEGIQHSGATEDGQTLPPPAGNRRGNKANGK